MSKEELEEFRKKWEQASNGSVSKAIEHEMSFGQKQNTDLVKRMDSDLFKGGLR